MTVVARPHQHGLKPRSDLRLPKADSVLARKTRFSSGNYGHAPSAHLPLPRIVAEKCEVRTSVVNRSCQHRGISRVPQAQPQSPCLCLDLILRAAGLAGKIHHLRAAARACKPGRRARGAVHVLFKPPFGDSAGALRRTLVAFRQMHVHREVHQSHARIGSRPPAHSERNRANATAGVPAGRNEDRSPHPDQAARRCGTEFHHRHVGGWHGHPMSRDHASGDKHGHAEARDHATPQD